MRVPVRIHSASFIHSFSVSSMPHTFDTEVPALAKHAAMAGGINVYSQLATSPIQNVDMSLNNDYFFAHQHKAAGVKTKPESSTTFGVHCRAVYIK